MLMSPQEEDLMQQHLRDENLPRRDAGLSHQHVSAVTRDPSPAHVLALRPMRALDC